MNTRRAPLLLNCDLGEGDADSDAAVMPYIDQANIACGFHAGDALTMERTLALAAAHGVAIGAHPAYPDRAGFGRVSMPLPAEELRALLRYQIAALAGMALQHGLALSHVKPHGALYHDLQANEAVRDAVLAAVASFDPVPALLLQARPVANTRAGALAQAAADAGVPVQFEAFADRRYIDDGALLPRGAPGAVLDEAAMLAQVAQLRERGTVTTASGGRLALDAQTLCVHGDNPAAVAAIRAVRALLRAG